MNRKRQTTESAGNGENGIPAGVFSAWLRDIRNALQAGSGMDVPCGGCIACCSSSYFIHVGPDEADALGHIPDELMFPAPGRKDGTVVLGFDKKGRCPMLAGVSCSIYRHRPATCRTFDCRVLPAAGFDRIEDNKPLITRQISRWEFSYPEKRDLDLHESVRAAAVFLGDHAALFPEGFVPGNPIQLAVLAVKVYGVFLPETVMIDGSDDTQTNARTAESVMDSLKEFDAGCA